MVIAYSSRKVQCFCPQSKQYNLHVFNMVNILPFVNMFAELSIFLLVLHPLLRLVPSCDPRNFKITNLQSQPVAYARVRYLQNGLALLEFKHVSCFIDGQTYLLISPFLLLGIFQRKQKEVILSIL
jgi:hypothetical protein